jgi:hypothetical protein
MRKLVLLIFGCLSLSNAFAQYGKDDILTYLDTYLGQAIKNENEMISEWKKQYTDTSAAAAKVRELISIQPPSFLITNAEIASYLYEQTRDAKYAKITRDHLFLLINHRDLIPEKYAPAGRNEREVPSVSWFRVLPIFIDCFTKTKNAGVYSRDDVQKVTAVVAKSANDILQFPEWGAHNRAMLRAESLIAAAIAFPDHSDAKNWRKMAEILAADSIAKWEIEDAQIYHAVWLRAYINYLDWAGKTDVFSSPMLKFYFDYLVGLLAPNRTIPEFGDGRWAEVVSEYYLILERGAREYKSGEMKWAANELFKKVLEQRESHFKKDEKKYAFYAPQTEFPALLIERAKYMDPTVRPIEPPVLSGDCIDEIISKKMVFRSDWSENANFLLLNYKDEGYFSLMQKNYLKRVLAVEEEKMHHGHSDENSICMWMKNGVLLLSDGGYREFAPSGEYGAYRADYFHNRVVVRNVRKSMHQPYFEILRNSGAYNDNVRTSKMDFQSFPEVEYSRTRLADPALDYQWDRIITRQKQEEFFIMVDALKFFKPGYFTIANMVHTQKILKQGDHWFVTRIEQIENKYQYTGNIDLMVIFPQPKYIGTEKENRNYQQELALFQGTSRYYDAGNVESFITILYPIKNNDDPDQIAKKFHLVRDDQRGMAVEYGTENGGKNVFGFKLDLDMDLIKEEIRPRYNYESGKIVYGDVETDADMFFLNQDKNGAHFAATNMVKFIHQGHLLFEAPECSFFQTWGKSDVKGRAKWRSWNNY